MSELRNKIDAAQDLPPMQKVRVDEWGNEIGIAVMPATDHGTFTAGQVGADGQVRLDDIKLRLLVRCLVDPATGERLYADNETEALGKRSSIVIDRLFAVAQDVNKLGPDSVGDLAKNSE
jgi:hypothetical protein